MPAPSDVLAIILAAGEGRRMGQPKALLAWGDRSLAAAHARAALDAGAAAVTVVVRASIREQIQGLPAQARLCVSAEPEALGAAGSIVAALRDAPIERAWFAICPVDVDPDAWRALATLTDAVDHRHAARPMIDGRRGHPVLVRRSALGPYLAPTPTPPPLREHLRALAAQVIDVPVDVRATLSNMDTPAQLAAQRSASEGD
jgi:CTP:molybdopterin cytidylyltransferase MocA